MLGSATPGVLVMIRMSGQVVWWEHIACEACAQCAWRHVSPQPNTEAMSMHALDVPVLIVGGGPTGLCASLLLSRHRVRSLLIERKPRTSEHPKARGLNVRTLELFRVWGVEQAVRAAVSKSDRPLDVVWAPTVVAPETRRVPYGGAGSVSVRTARRRAPTARRRG
jgi:hypothetical protein